MCGGCVYSGRSRKFPTPRTHETGAITALPWTPTVRLASHGEAVTVDHNVDQLASWLRQCPVDALAHIVERLDAPSPVATPSPSPDWPEKLWLVDPNTRMTKEDVMAAMSRNKGWLHRHTGPKCPCTPIPCRMMDGRLAFLAGEVRVWMTRHETVVHPLVQARAKKRGSGPWTPTPNIAKG